MKNDDPNSKSTKAVSFGNGEDKNKFSKKKSILKNGTEADGSNRKSMQADILALKSFITGYDKEEDEKDIASKLKLNNNK